MRKMLGSHIRGNVVGYVALFFAMTGGVAWATHPGGANTISSGDIQDNQVFSADVRNDNLTGGGLAATDLKPSSVGTSEVAANALTGVDVNESSLGQVPSALLGGFGRSQGGQNCNPEGVYIPCAEVTLNVPRQSRFLLIGQARAFSETVGVANGSCRVGTAAAPISDTETLVGVPAGGVENVAIAGVTGPLSAGLHSLRIECSDIGGDIQFQAAGITAVAISPG